MQAVSPEYQFIFFLVRLLLLAAFVERMVAVGKSIVLSPKWPALAAVVSITLCWQYDWRIIAELLQRPATGSGWIDYISSGLIISGGASGIFDTIRKWSEQRDALLSLKLNGGSNVQVGKEPVHQ